MTTENTFHRGPALTASLLEVPDLNALVREGAVHTVMVGVPDMTGRLKGKLLDARTFLDTLPAGPDMCAYVLATDLDMKPQPGYLLTGWHNGYGDLHVVPDTSTLRYLSYLPGTALVHGDAFHPDGRPVEVAPRQMLRDQLAVLASLGLTAKVGIESEFALYKGTPAHLHRRGHRDLTPAFPQNLDYALDHPPALSAFFHDLRTILKYAGCRTSAIKTEGAPGQVEVTWPYGDPLAACDTYTVHQHAVRHLAPQHRMTPTFMAAPQTGVGSGMHLHLSLWADDQPVFATGSREELPDLLEHSLAGLIAALPDMAPLYAPTPNSYKRYQPHSFAPTNFSWGWDNRTCAVRVVGRHSGTHLEVRTAGADANPYLALAATLAAITHGLHERPKLPAPCTGNAYQTHGPRRVPRTLREAVDDFTSSSIVHSAFPLPVVEHYMHAATIEIDALAGQVTDVERERGFDRV
ncbi:glutamine synthetase family protein [Streptomyces sp. NPDC006285]|uniref:glutamine synthetase family protein n=1 Tax=Streptomyces sp. NPDC006285 TaxID=3364742 RepID=UPI0036B3F8FE